MSQVGDDAAVDCAAEEQALIEDGVLELDFQSFDQDLEGGWRTLANRGCMVEAATLIERYLEENPAAANERTNLLHFHAGQVLAFSGETDRAISHFERSFESFDLILQLREDEEDELADMLVGWNLYVEGTLAFLRRDREALTEALGELRTHDDDVSRTNLAIVERFLENFDGTYADAYRSDTGDR